MYRAKAKSIAGAVMRRSDELGGKPMFSMGANWNTKVNRFLRYVEDTEMSPGFVEFCKVKSALVRFGSIRAAVKAGYFEGGL